MKIGDHFNVTCNDNYNTPKEAFEFLFSHTKNIEKYNVWFPFYNDGSLKNILDSMKLKYVHENKDFFKYKPKNFDLIIDNPPFSCKKEILERCIELKKPFALLLPIDTLERHYISDYFKDSSKLKILIPKKRYQYNNEYIEKKKRVPFKSIWITYDFPISNKSNIIFE